MTSINSSTTASVSMPLDLADLSNQGPLALYDAFENQAEPTFVALGDYFKTFKNFWANPSVPGVDSQDKTTETPENSLQQASLASPMAGTNSQFAETLANQALATLSKYGLSLTDLKNTIINKSIINRKLFFQGQDFQIYCQYVGTDKTSTLLTNNTLFNNITNHKTYDAYNQGYSGIVLSFYQELNGKKYLFTQTETTVPVVGQTKLCYLVEITQTDLPDGSVLISRSLVTDSDIQNNVINASLQNGKLASTITSAKNIHNDRLFVHESPADYAQKALDGFKNIMDGYQIYNFVSPFGFVIQLTHFHTSNPMVQTMISNALKYKEGNDYTKAINKIFGL